MPEAVKETVTEVVPSESKEVLVEKPTEACSGTLPIDDKAEPPATPVEGAKPEDGMEADQPHGAEQPVEEKNNVENGVEAKAKVEDDSVKTADEKQEPSTLNGAEVNQEPTSANEGGAGDVPSAKEEMKEGAPPTNSDEKPQPSEAGDSTESSEKLEEATKTTPSKEDSGKNKVTFSEDTKEEETGSSQSVGGSASGGEGKSKEVDPALDEEINALVQKGKVQLALKEYEAASELFGKACEVAAAAYGELSEKCGDLYYNYGCALLECGKAENTVLGEGVKKDVEESEEEEEILPQVIDKTKDENEESKNEGDEKEKVEPTEEKMETDEVPSEPAPTESKQESKEDKEEMEEEQSKEKEEEEGGESDSEDIEKVEEDESSLKVAWEVFELAKIVFEKHNHREKLIDAYMKLGEVNFESGHASAIDDMVKALHLQKELFPNKLRSISHTHFNIGLTLATFEKFAEAADQFKSAKGLLEDKVKELSELNTDEAKEEVKEIQDLLPDIEEKISDMLESQADKKKELQNGEKKEETSYKKSEDKPVTNISHLVKRKRKLDEEGSDAPSPASKQPCTDERNSEVTENGTAKVEDA